MIALDDIKRVAVADDFHPNLNCLTQQLAYSMMNEDDLALPKSERGDHDHVFAVLGLHYSGVDMRKFDVLYSRSLLFEQGPDGHTEAMALAERLFA